MEPTSIELKLNTIIIMAFFYVPVTIMDVYFTQCCKSNLILLFAHHLPTSEELNLLIKLYFTNYLT